MRTAVLGLLAGVSGVMAIHAQGPGSAPPADYALAPVPFTAVRFTDDFWAPRLEINRTVSIPHILSENERTGRVANFAKAGGKVPGKFEGRRYNDTDVYKAIEAASYALAAHPDPSLAARIDEIVTLVAAAQERDGYLFTTRTIDPKNPAPGAGPERWAWLSTSHELYNAGHLYEAAVAHYQATGTRTLLDVALRNAELVVRTFGPGRRRDTSGHQEIELALVKLYRVTRDERFLHAARFFLDERGGPHAAPMFPTDSPFVIYNDRAYRQDHAPVREQTRAIGHAVRATYMYSGMTDVGTLLADASLVEAVERLWQDVVSRRMYLTGGLGSRGETEAFGADYQLPNADAYAETCASIGGLLWYHRMFLRTADARYLDVLERTLYNGVLSGVSLAGDTFFYVNPLSSDGKAERQRYFDVACCPANLARVLGQLPGLVYAQRGSEIFVNLFAGSEANLTVAGIATRISQATRYPWDGAVRITVSPERPAAFDLLVRVPGWARGEPVPSDLYRYADTNLPAGTVVVSVNGTPVGLDPVKGFARVRRTWNSGDVVELRLPMPARRVLAHPGAKENSGRAALERGPLVYAVEAVDHGGAVADLVLPLNADLTATFRPDLLGGVTVVTGRLGGRAGNDSGASGEVVAIPYFAWANRGKGQMAVWLRHGGS